MTRPLAIDLFCGLGGWTDGLHDAGYYVVGFDIERHVYGEHRYPGQLVIQDVLTLHGSQFKGAALIVASPPCQEYSYMAMPWKRAKAKAAAIRADKSGKMLANLNRLFDACFRIQREGCEAAGQHIPLVVENVRGAQEWVGRARWNFGSYYLWGDVPALMPMTLRAYKSQGMNWSDQAKRGQDFTRIAGNQAIKKNHEIAGIKGVPHRTKGHWTNPAEHEGVKHHGSGAAWFDKALDERRREATALKQPGIKLSEVGFNVANAREFGAMVEGVKIKRSEEDKRQHIGTSRKFASAMIAKIPFALSSHIARSFLSQPGRDAA